MIMDCGEMAQMEEECHGMVTRTRDPADATMGSAWVLSVLL